MRVLWKPRSARITILSCRGSICRSSKSTSSAMRFMLRFNPLRSCFKTSVRMFNMIPADKSQARRHGHEDAGRIGARGALAKDRAIITSPQVRWQQGRPQAGTRPGLSGGDHFCSPIGLPVAAGSIRPTGVRISHHRLATLQRVDCRRRVGPAARGIARGTGGTRTDRFVAGGHRRPAPAGAFWGRHTGPNPTDRAKNGCKRHLITDGPGTPLLVHTTPANWRDDKPALELIRKIPQLPDAHGRIHHRPGCMLGDSAYGTCQIILPIMLDGIVPLLAKAGHREHGSGLGRWRYVVERTFTWFGHCRRLLFCYEKYAEHFQAFNVLAAAQIS